ncbi:MAG: hypothetical protein NZ825_01315 [Candidatus Marinimicrobia bacterium]|nr:hypothetical protein [Candidatus Neomarinimicrobiota bacterium]
MSIVGWVINMLNRTVALEAEDKKSNLRIFNKRLQVESSLSNVTRAAIEWKNSHWNFSIFEFPF